MKKYLQYINNRWVENGETFLSYNKANGQAVNGILLGRAGKRGRRLQCLPGRPQRSWAGMDADTRADYMMKAASIMRRRQRELAELEAMETGKAGL